jgi:hypothetical protein
MTKIKSLMTGKEFEVIQTGSVFIIKENNEEINFRYDDNEVSISLSKNWKCKFQLLTKIEESVFVNSMPYRQRNTKTPLHLCTTDARMGYILEKGDTPFDD